MAERDQFRKETKEILDMKNTLQREKATAMEAFKKRIIQM
jgi:hypothetical protein